MDDTTGGADFSVSQLNVKVNRREALAAGAVTVAGIALAGCGGDSSGTTSASGTQGSTGAAAGKPVRGGTLTAGVISNGQAEGIGPDPLQGGYTGAIRVPQLYETLFTIDKDGRTLMPKLALSAEPNKDATVWTIKLRDGVVFHNGDPFTADDVVWTINTWNSKTSLMGVCGGQFIDYKNVRKKGELEVEIPLVRPVGQFPYILAGPNATDYMIPKGGTVKELAKVPNGTGPFKYVSFTPGSQSVFERFDDYWQSGKPYLDRLVVDSSFSDDAARNNALLSGKIDVMPVYPFTMAKQQQSGGQVNVLNVEAANLFWFSTRIDKPPFTDPRVRQAIKLTLDRQAFVDNVFVGFGQVGNDNFGVGLEYYDPAVPARDVEKAKALLKAAGQENLTATLDTAPVAAGAVEAATLFAVQMKDAGMNIKVNQMPAATYYTEAGGYFTRAFGMDSGTVWPTLTNSTIMTLLPGAPLNHTGWSDTKAVYPAVAALESDQAQEQWAAMQQQQTELGGDYIPAWPNLVDAVAKRVKNLEPSKAGSCNKYDFTSVWLEG